MIKYLNLPPVNYEKLQLCYIQANILAMLMDVKWYLVVGLVCIFLITSFCLLLKEVRILKTKQTKKVLKDCINYSIMYF